MPAHHEALESAPGPTVPEKADIARDEWAVCAQAVLVGLLAHYWNHADQMERLRQKVLEAGERTPVPRRKVRRSRQPTAEDVERLVAERLAGAEIKALAQEFGVHRSTVIAHLTRAGVEHRTRAGRTLTPEQIQAAGQLYQSGLSLLAVGEQFDVDKRYLQRVLPEAGFVIRRAGQQKRGWAALG